MILTYEHLFILFALQVKGGMREDEICEMMGQGIQADGITTECLGELGTERLATYVGELWTLAREGDSLVRLILAFVGGDPEPVDPIKIDSVSSGGRPVGPSSLAFHAPRGHGKSVLAAEMRKALEGRSVVVPTKAQGLDLKARMDGTFPKASLELE